MEIKISGKAMWNLLMQMDKDEKKNQQENAKRTHKGETGKTAPGPASLEYSLFSIKLKEFENLSTDECNYMLGNYNDEVVLVHGNYKVYVITTSANITDYCFRVKPIKVIEENLEISK